jgi:hypothetical protein
MRSKNEVLCAAAGRLAAELSEYVSTYKRLVASAFDKASQ